MVVCFYLKNNICLIQYRYILCRKIFKQLLFNTLINKSEK